MSAIMSLTSIVRKEMGDLISTHTLKLVEVGSNDVLLKSSTYALNIYADKEGVSVIYFDTLQKPVKGYNVLRFLVNKRREQLALTTDDRTTSSYADFVESETKCIAQHLRNAGQDILRGSKDWIKKYPWPVGQPVSEIAALM